MKPTKQIAVFIETSRAYGRGLLRGVSRFHMERQTWSICFKPQDLGTGFPRWLKTWRGDGILARVTNSRMARQLLETGLPVIDLRGSMRELGAQPFGCDNESVCRVAYEHLKERGLRNFAFVGEPVGYHVYDDERRDRFSKLVELEGGTCHVFAYRGRARQPISWEVEQRQFMNWIASLPKPVGIMAVHDDRGMQVLEACRALDIRVPDQVAVVGVDNDEFLCNLAVPPLSSVDPNSERIGYEAAKLLDRLVEGEPPPDRAIYIPPVGVVARQSTDVLMVRDREVAEAIRFIRQHACQRISVLDVERHTALSRSLLNRRFKQAMGHSPKAEILHVQVDTARRLLIDTELAVAEVATLAGFSESKYFIAVFDRYVGLTPRAFRVQCGRASGLVEQKSSSAGGG